MLKFHREVIDELRSRLPSATFTILRQRKHTILEVLQGGQRVVTSLPVSPSGRHSIQQTCNSVRKSFMSQSNPLKENK